MSKYKIFIFVLAGLYAVFIAWFAALYVTQTYEGIGNLYTNTYGVIALIGGIYGLFLSHSWGGFKSAIGKAIFFLSSGLITYSAGLVIWLYYNLVLGVSVPYPSIADFVFIISWPLWTTGAIFLSFATGANLGLKNLHGKVFLFIIPAVVAAFSYYVLVVVARQGFVSAYDDLFKTFFDLAYPGGDILILTIVALVFGLSYKYLGGRYKTAIYVILGAFVVNYIADFMFTYTTTLETYYNGSLSDALYVTALTLLSIGIASFTLPDYKNKSFSIITSSAGNNTTVFHQMMIKIIKKQELIIGISAWYEANNVAGFTIDKENGLVSFFGDGRQATDRLVTHYEKIFGRASRGVCKEAVKDFIPVLASTEIPESLR